MELSPSQQPNQFDLEYENGVGTILNNWIYYTYDIWPSHEIKKDVLLNFYQKPIYNYRLECQLEDGRDMASLTAITQENTIGVETSQKMFKSYL